MKLDIDRGFFNVLILSWGYMFTFSAFQTMGIVQKSVLDAVEKEIPNFTGDGYYSFAILFAASGISLFFSPVYATLISSRVSLIVGGLTTVLFVGTFFWPEKTLLYVVSAIHGIGFTVIWIGSGRCITENSTPSTISRNSGVFWATYQLCLVVGNLFIYFTFASTSFDKATRYNICTTLMILALIGCAIYFLSRKPPNSEAIVEENKIQGDNISNDYSFQTACLRMKKALVLIYTPNLMLLSITFLYIGLVLSFYSGVYASCVGFTVKMGKSRHYLVSLTGIAIGIGEIVGAILSGPVASRVKVLSSPLLIGLGFLAEFICYTIALLIFPNDAPFGDTEDIGFIMPSASLALIGGFCLGFGDSCFNTQNYNFLGTIYKENAASAFAFFYFCQSITVTLSFLGSNHIGLHLQLSIFFILGCIGTVAYIYVHFNTTRTEKSKDSISIVESYTQKC